MQHKTLSSFNCITSMSFYFFYSEKTNYKRAQKFPAGHIRQAILKAKTETIRLLTIITSDWLMIISRQQKKLFPRDFFILQVTKKIQPWLLSGLERVSEFK